MADLQEFVMIQLFLCQAAQGQPRSHWLKRRWFPKGHWSVSNEPGKFSKVKATWMLAELCHMSRCWKAVVLLLKLGFDTKQNKQKKSKVKTFNQHPHYNFHLNSFKDIRASPLRLWKWQTKMLLFRMLTVGVHESPFWSQVNWTGHRLCEKLWSGEWGCSSNWFTKNTQQR